MQLTPSSARRASDDGSLTHVQGSSLNTTEMAAPNLQGLSEKGSDAALNAVLLCNRAHAHSLLGERPYWRLIPCAHALGTLLPCRALPGNQAGNVMRQPCHTCLLGAFSWESESAPLQKSLYPCNACMHAYMQTTPTQFGRAPSPCPCSLGVQLAAMRRGCAQVHLQPHTLFGASAHMKRMLHLVQTRSSPQGIITKHVLGRVPGGDMPLHLVQTRSSPQGIITKHVLGRVPGGDAPRAPPGCSCMGPPSQSCGPSAACNLWLEGWRLAL